VKVVWVVEGKWTGQDDSAYFPHPRSRCYRTETQAKKVATKWTRDKDRHAGSTYRVARYVPEAG